MKTVLKTALSYLGSFLLALLLAGLVTYGINIKDHGHFVGIVVCYSVYFMGFYLALVVPFLIVVHIVIRRSCAHVRLPLVAILSCAVGFLGLVEYSPSTAGHLIHFLFVFSISVVLPVFSISLGATAALWQFRSSDVKVQKKFRVFSSLTILAAILLFLTISIFLFRFAHIRKLEKLEGVEHVTLQEHDDVVALSSLPDQPHPR